MGPLTPVDLRSGHHRTIFRSCFAPAPGRRRDERRTITVTRASAQGIIRTLLVLTTLRPPGKERPGRFGCHPSSAGIVLDAAPPIRGVHCCRTHHGTVNGPRGPLTAAPYYPHGVSTSAAPNGEGFEVVVGTDGALRVPAEELARHGLRPGAHLRLVLQPQPPAQRRHARGALAGVVTAAALDGLEAALDEAKTERIAALERRWA